MDQSKEQNASKIYVGIDLGTTNTSASLLRPEKDNPEELKILQKSHNTTRAETILPSILFRKSNGEEVVGLEAEDLKENYIAREQDEVRYLENTKRYIGTKSTFTIDNKTYTPIDVAATLLEYVKKYSQINKIKGEFHTVITVPAKFRNDQRNATLEAARRAGFVNNVELYDEPKAAILSFLHEDSQSLGDKRLDLSKKKRILVIDIGGGTCDISVEDVELKEDKYVFAHKAVGRNDLGGVDFDVRIGDELAKKYLKDIKLGASDVALLRTTGQKIKEDISGQIDYFLYSQFDGNEASLYAKVDWLDILENEGIECSISREIQGKPVNFNMDVREFFNTISTLIYHTSDSVASNKDEREINKNMEEIIDETLAYYDISIKSVDMIFLTGGMAKCFPLKAALFEIFQKPIICPSDPLLAVSNGASLVGRYKSIDESSPDLMPNAIMMEMEDGRLETLIEMGESVPVKKKVDKVFRAGRTGVTIRLFEGKNAFDSQLRRINNSYIIEFERPQLEGREFEIVYSVDKTKRINFVVTFLDNGERYVINGQVKEAQQ